MSTNYSLPDSPLVDLPSAVISVGEIGHLTVTLNGTEFQAPDLVKPWTRAQFGDLLDLLTLNRTRAIRIEVRESDGTVFTDIIHPKQSINLSASQKAQPQPPSLPRRARRSRPPELLELTGRGFIPGEDITVALNISSAESNMQGEAHALVDLATMFEEVSEILLIGNISGRVISNRLP